MLRPAGGCLPAWWSQPNQFLVRLFWLLLWVAAPVVVCVAQVDLGPHDIGGRGCMACHIVTTDASGQTVYAWPGDLATQTTDPSAPLLDEGWSHSAKCLSCHDGVMAQVMDMEGAPVRPSVIGPHPVNVRYKPNRGDLFPMMLVGGEWRLINNPENPFTNLKLFRRNAFDLTPTVQCASCHDPHDHRNAFFLRDPYDRYYLGTKFCRTCHAEESMYAAVP